jgi:hypothetical protein
VPAIICGALIVSACLAIALWLRPYQRRPVPSGELQIWWMYEKLWQLDSWLSSILWLGWCIAVTWIWRLQFVTQEVWLTVAAVAVVLAGFGVAAEVGVGLFARFKFDAPPWVDICVGVLAAVLAVHHLSELFIQKRELQIPGKIGELLDEYRSVIQRRKDPGDKMERDKYLAELMAKFSALLMQGSKRKIWLSLMLSENGQPLSTHVVRPENEDLKSASTWKKGEGAAGTAWKDNNLVYIPSTAHRGGINGDTFELYTLRKPPYVPSGKEKKFASLLCVPILLSDELVLVINVLSDRKRALSQLDFRICELARVFIVRGLLTGAEQTGSSGVDAKRGGS